MREKTKLPEDLQKTCDEVVAAFHSGGEFKEGIEQIQTWLEVEGWDDLIADLGDQMAIALGSVAQDKFMDDELRAYMDISDDVPVTDGDRIRWARDQIADVMRGDDEDTYRCLHAYTLEASNGMTAVIGCIVAMLGMHSMDIDWCGIWKSKDDLCNSFRGDDCYWIWPFMGDVPDDVILSFWKK